MRTQFTDALVLRTVDYGDADRVVTLLTAELGKVSVLARGARRSRRRFAGSLEPCALVRAEVGRGRGELGVLKQATVVRGFPSILASLRAMALASVGLELLREATMPREPDRRLFETAVDFLKALSEAARPELVVAFQVRVLTLVGFEPELHRCASCGREAALGQAAKFDPLRGSVVCRACGGAKLYLSGATRRLLARATGSGWAAQPEWDSRSLAEGRALAHALAETQLEKRLGAAEVLEQIEELP